MKSKILLLTVAISVFVSSTIYANENVLKLEDVLKDVDKSPTIQNFEYDLKNLYNYYETTKEIADLIPVGIRSKAQSDLSQPVVGPPITAFVFGIPITYDHTLSKTEITQILANFGFSYTKKDRLSEDLMVYNTPKELLSNYEVLQKTKELTTESLKLSVKDLYSGILIQEKALSLQEEIIENDKFLLENNEIKLNQGIMSQNDFDSFKLTVEQNALKRDIQKRTIENMKFSLNNLLGKDITESYENLENIIIENEEAQIDIEKSIENALNNRFEIYQINQNIINLERELLFTNIYYGQNEPQYLSKKYELSVQKQNLEDTKEDIRYELYDAYETLTLYYNEIKRAKVGLENANITYKDIMQKYQNGLITKDILNMTHIRITSAQITLTGAISTYNMALDRFNMACGFGPKFMVGGTK